MDFSIPAKHCLHSSYNSTVTRSWLSKKPSPSSLIFPVFISEDAEEQTSFETIPGISRFGYKKIVAYLEPLVAEGLTSILLFGIINDVKLKDEIGTLAGGNGKPGPVHFALEEIKKKLPGLYLICDVCLCEYTSHGHCGILNKDGVLDNVKSVKRLVDVAKSYVEYGCDMIAPSDMMDGRIGAFKKSLLSEGLERPVLAYSAKFCSSFYGPFRDICNSAPQKGDRKGYQLPSDSKELALRAVARDIEEGADFIMVKPITAYLDIVCEIKKKFDCVVSCYQTSGEYAMIYFAAQAGAIDKKRVVLEYMTSFKRAGVDIIITYFVPELLKWLKE